MPTVLHRLASWAESDPDSVAQRYISQGQWKDITTREMFDRVYHLALFLKSRGIGPSDVSCILSSNCPEWVHTDLAVLLLRAKSAGLYPNSNAKDIAYILNHTEARLLSVQNKEFFNKIVDENGKPNVPARVELILSYDGDTSFSPKAVGIKTALEEGKKIAKTKGARGAHEYLAQLDANAGAFMIYTSGTTGNPKGAILSHDNLVFTSDTVAKQWKLPFARGTLFSFLPLCHVAERLQNVAVGICQRYTVNFCSKFENVSLELPQIQPTLLLCVPRLWEKMMEGVLAKIRKAPPHRKALATWALGVGARVAEARFQKKIPSPLDYAQYLVADRLVLGKIRHALGLAKAEVLASGAAALAPHIARWFRCLGLEILEDFGQTESTGVICMTEPGVDSLGTVGKPPEGIEVKIAEDGEIICRGRNVFVGYFKDDAATATSLNNGWLHTGDIGVVNQRGLIEIRGRKKEVLKTSGGKMIAPLPIEERLKAAEMISQVCMVGDGRKYLSALITLSETMLAELKGKNGTLNGKVIQDRDVVDQVKQHVDDLNKSLASYEQIKRFSVLTREFSIIDGEMTPTLKMKRNVIEIRFKEVIDQMYGAGD